jgi:hypothetical protein
VWGGLFAYDALVKRDQVNLGIFWLKDDALDETANLLASEIIAQEITDGLEAALEQFATIAKDLKEREIATVKSQQQNPRIVSNPTRMCSQA